MATPNYGYEKRQRELAKKKKKEEKLRTKAADRRPDDVSQGGQGGDQGSQTPDGAAPDAGTQQPS